LGQRLEELGEDAGGGAKDEVTAEVVVRFANTKSLVGPPGLTDVLKALEVAERDFQDLRHLARVQLVHIGVGQVADERGDAEARERLLVAEAAQDGDVRWEDADLLLALSEGGCLQSGIARLDRTPRKGDLPLVVLDATAPNGEYDSALLFVSRQADENGCWAKGGQGKKSGSGPGPRI
jgi:hypothetical protein